MRNKKYRSITVRLDDAAFTSLEAIKEQLENFYARKPVSYSEAIRATFDMGHTALYGRANVKPVQAEPEKPAETVPEIPKKKRIRKPKEVKPKKVPKPSANGKIKEKKTQPVVK